MKEKIEELIKELTRKKEFAKTERQRQDKIHENMLLSMGYWIEERANSYCIEKLTQILNETAVCDSSSA